MLKLDSKKFKQYVYQLEQSGIKFIVEKKRMVSNVIINGRYFALSKNKNHAAKNEKKQEVVSLFAAVAKHINQYILKNNFKVNDIEQRHNSTYTNREKYYKMKIGATFYYVDIAHCFWRIAYINGYIGKNLYESVLRKSGLKTFRNMALACIVAPKIREYYSGGKLINTITEDKEMYKIIYDNIRFTSYNIMGDTAQEVEKYCIGYRTDGIMVTRPAMKKVRNALEDANLGYRVIKCFKIDNSHFYYGKRVMRI